ncbi:class I SAM-dependent methyltransferase [Streptomyces iconiensis]|uniref:Class I SAM-dependent methyltransferase n=1 Tax=Streptomyces iconiensis TaxID=1384038 RepID=A0ABT7A2Y3_9ACTN|nr:class I SAM-dependent methyltransferase [Streptomyces iconiensis]MDJ1134983.1 class I SAM-dependent methyltransferase [Streptomyces iconiensis]
MNTLKALRGALSLPRVYVLFQRAVWGRAERELVRRHIQPSEGLRVLDIGCGPADILRLMPRVTYVGFDHSARYVDWARRRFGNRGEFRLADVDSSPSFEAAAYDVVLAKGVLHHVDDPEAERLFRIAHGALRPGGRLITTDGCHHPDQPALHRKVTSMDRGQFIRTPDAYRRLGEPYFSQASVHLRDDLLRIPYSVAIGVYTR